MAIIQPRPVSGGETVLESGDSPQSSYASTDKYMLGFKKGRYLEAALVEYLFSELHRK